MKDIELTGSQEVLDELQSGRTRELLLLLQDRPIPEVVDPLNLQSGLSQTVVQDGSDYQIGSTTGSTASRPSDNISAFFGSTNEIGLLVNPNLDIPAAEVTISGNNVDLDSVALIRQSDSETLATKDTSGLSNGDSFQFNVNLSAGTDYRIVATQWSEIGLYDSADYPYTSTDIDIVNGYSDGVTSGDAYAFSSVTALVPALSGYVTDQFSAPTTAPADFKQWNAIRAEDVTTGGSTSTNPVEFEILDSTDTVLTSSRIPISELSDEPFALRDREYSEDAGSDGQADYTIPETGDGGHYGIPILSVVTVEQNGSVLDPSNWEFDGTDTVTIDTSTVSITSGDTITIAYDFDVFDSTLQPRAYLSRESSDETSPSISHFRYEYVI